MAVATAGWLAVVLHSSNNSHCCCHVSHFGLWGMRPLGLCLGVSQSQEASHRLLGMELLFCPCGAPPVIPPLVHPCAGAVHALHTVTVTCLS
jgi:hypothetical protein